MTDSNGASLPEVRNVYDIIDMQAETFNQISTSDEIAWKKESVFAKQLLQNNSYLNGIAWKNKDSLRDAIINVASIGISLNPATKHAYLVPRENRVCLDISYMGLLHLAMKTGAVAWGQAKIVYANDNYLNNGLDKQPTHSYSAFGDRGDPIGAFCTVKTPNGDYITEEMSKDMIHDIRSRSKAFTSGKSCPWTTDELEMWRKTVVKRASKYWPSSERFSEAVRVINDHEGIEIDTPDLLPDDKREQFLDMIYSEKPFTLAAFMSDHDEEGQTILANCFDRGKISAGKAALRKLQAEGFTIWQEFIEDIKAYIADNDKMSLQSETMDLEPFEKRMLCRLLGEDLSQELKTILTGE